MSGKALNSFPSLVMLAAAAGFVALGLQFRSTDMAAMAAAKSNDPVVIPAVPPAAQVADAATDAFERPLFHRDRQPGPDGPPAALPGDDPDAPDASTEDAPAPTLKGLIIGVRGGKASLAPSDGSGAVWVKVGEDVGGWTVEAITSKGVRVRNGDEVAELNFKKDN